MDLEKTAPILCAGITMYSPLKFHGATGKEKKTVGVVGIGMSMNYKSKYKFDLCSSYLCSNYFRRSWHNGYQIGQSYGQ